MQYKFYAFDQFNEKNLTEAKIRSINLTGNNDKSAVVSVIGAGGKGKQLVSVLKLNACIIKGIFLDKSLVLLKHFGVVFANILIIAEAVLILGRYSCVYRGNDLITVPFVDRVENYLLVLFLKALILIIDE